MTTFVPSQLQTASLTDVGRTRSENQDACAEFRGSSGARLLAVADGMGGHQGGATASRIAIETLGEVFARTPEPDEAMLRDALESSNARVYRAAQERAELRGMGTTCVALLFGANGDAWVAHVGDSRVYLLRDGHMAPLTVDHSTVAELVRLGEITEEEAAVHPRRNEIPRSIGAESSVAVDVAPVEVRPGDQFLLCSDGLSGPVADPEMGAVLLRETPEAATRILVDLANERGGPDNVTVMVTAVPGAVAGASHAAEPSWESEPARARTRRRMRWIAAAAAVVAVLLVISLVLLVLTSQEFSVGDARLRDRATVGETAASQRDVAAPARPAPPPDPAP